MAEPEFAKEMSLASVTQVNPLRVIVDGATVDSPAAKTDNAARNLGDRVNVTPRNPRPPLVLGVES